MVIAGAFAVSCDNDDDYNVVLPVYQDVIFKSAKPDTAFIDEDGVPIDLGRMLVRALELSTGAVISKDLALANYYE